MSNIPWTVAVVDTMYPSPFVPGELIDIQGAINDQINMQCEIVSVAAQVLTVRPATLRNLLLRHVYYYVWRSLRWAIEDAYFEFSELWDEAKEDWRTCQ